MSSTDNWLIRGLSRVVAVMDKSNPAYRVSYGASVLVLALLVLVTVIDVILRYIFKIGWIKDTIGLTEMLLVVILFMAVAYVQTKKANISINMITSRLSARGRVVLETFNSFLNLGIIAIATWRSLIEALHLMDTNSHTQSGLPLFPFAFVVTLGCLMLAIVLLRDLLETLLEALKLRIGVGLWVLSLGLTAVVAAAIVLWMRPALWSISMPVVGVTGIAIMLVLMFLGMPIGFSMLLTSLAFMAHVTSTKGGLNLLGGILFSAASNYDFTAVYFFILMGSFVFASGLGKDLYYAAYRWLGHVAGGLATSTIGACAVFAATVGDMLPSVVTFGRVALPEMKKYKYDDALATGCVMAGATLGPLIPPSMTFIIYGVLTGESIGKLFAANAFPGILLALAFMATIYIMCRFNPRMGPPGERSPWKARFISLKDGGPVVILFLLVVGGIYTGAFCPTEGAAVGAAMVLIISLLMKRFNAAEFLIAIKDTVRLAGSVFLIIIGSKALGYFIAASDFVTEMSKFITSLGLTPIGVVIVVLIIYLLLGCVMSAMALLFISIPIFYPLVTGMGIDGIWFGVVIMMVVHVGAITPPYGMVLFAMRPIAKDVPMETLFKGVIPFVIATLLVIVIVFVAPKVATWLPYLIL